MRDFAERLLKITDGCRPDMHEPDEQEISAHVVGDHLDNACCESVTVNAIEGVYQEYVLVITKKTDDGRKKEKFNLATLIALARIGARNTL